jgi:hypothetical protein
MSDSNDSSSGQRFKLAVRLEDSANYSRWRTGLQDLIFVTIQNNNMDKLTCADTLQHKYFKKLFKDEAKLAEDDDKEEPLQQPAYLKLCRDYAFDTGKGFHPWVYTMFKAVRDSLAGDIFDKTVGVAQGDLLGLLSGIKLAVGHIEAADAYDLEAVYTACTMEQGGHNDVMKYTAVMAQYISRLEVAGNPQTDKKTQSVLIRGLPEKIFESFIVTSEITPHVSYAVLVAKLLEFAHKPRNLAKLNALKPGVTHSVMSTQAKIAADKIAADDERLTRIETMMATMAARDGSQTHDSKSQSCHEWQRSGTCKYGSSCQYSHKGPAGKTGEGRKHERPSATGSGNPCFIHLTTSTARRSAPCSPSIPRRAKLPVFGRRPRSAPRCGGSTPPRGARNRIRRGQALITCLSPLT